MARISIIIPVLDSHEVVRRQCLHLGRILDLRWEVVFVDDGSDKPIVLPETGLRARVIPTHDKRPWTQPRARNIGARKSEAPRLLFLDVDHILTERAARAALRCADSCLFFKRRYGYLDEAGQLHHDAETLAKQGLPPGIPLLLSPSPSAFLINRESFGRAGGFDERFCGDYGYDDVDFNRRCGEMTGDEPECGPAICVFPIPVKLFHRLPRALDRKRAQRIKKPLRCTRSRRLATPRENGT